MEIYNYIYNKKTLNLSHEKTIDNISSSIYFFIIFYFSFLRKSVMSWIMMNFFVMIVNFSYVGIALGSDVGHFDAPWDPPLNPTRS